MEQSGGNISTRTGEGDAYVYNWQGVHQTLNQIAQRDYLHERQLKDEYLRAQTQIQQAQKGIRAADLPLFQDAYGKYKNASLALMQKGITKNPQQYAEYTRQQNEGLAEAMSLAERSKEASKLKGSFYDQWMKDGGLNASEDFGDKMKLFDHLNVDQIREHNFDNPMNFFNPKDDTPKDVTKDILGDQKEMEDRTPILDEKGKVKAYGVQKLFGYATPPDVVATNAAQVLAKSKSETMRTRQEYANGNPQDIANVMDNANKIIAQTGGHPLPHDYTGYYAAKWINQAATKTPAGSKKEEPDQGYLQQQGYAHADALHADSENNANARFNAGQAATQKRFNQSQAAQQKRFEKLHSDAGSMISSNDMTPIYNAFKTGDRTVAEKSLSAIAENNPNKPVPVTISRLDILDPVKRRAILDKFGINEKDIEFNVGKNESVQSMRDRQVAKVVEAINGKAGGTKIKPEDLSQGKIVGALIHLDKMKVLDKLGQPTGELKQTRLPVIFNPHSSSLEQFKAELSNEYVNKKKPNLAAQVAALEDINSSSEEADPLGLGLK